MPPTTRKGRSGNPAVAAQQETDKYAPTAWGQVGAGGFEDLTLPSGQLALVRRPGVEGLMKAGVLRNIDSLTRLINEDHIERVNGKTSIDMNSIMADEEQMAEITHVIDRVVCHCVVKPPVEMTPSDVTNRQPRVMYADMIDLTDKVFIFNFVVGGTRDLESFRGGLDELLGGVADVADLPDATE